MLSSEQNNLRKEHVDLIEDESRISGDYGNEQKVGQREGLRDVLPNQENRNQQPDQELDLNGSLTPSSKSLENVRTAGQQAVNHPNQLSKQALEDILNDTRHLDELGGPFNLMAEVNNATEERMKEEKQ